MYVQSSKEFQQLLSLCEHWILIGTIIPKSFYNRNGETVDKIFCFLGKSSNQRYNLSNLGTELYADGKRIHQWSDRLRHTAKEVPNRMLITLRQEMTVLSSFQTGCFNDISALALIRKLF